MNLCCEEVCANTGLAESTSRGAFDENILNDNRVLEQLLKNEERYIPLSFVCTYKSVQSEISPEMRKVLSLWMLEVVYPVCEELKCDEIVFPLAINYVDRFLSSTNIRKSQLQLLGAVCLLIASKLRQCEAIHSEDLVYYSDHSLTAKEIIVSLCRRPANYNAWELLVLSRLKWDISSVVATDFVDHLLVRLRLNKDQLLTNAKSDKKLIETIRRHTSTFIALCSTDLKFSMFAPSMIAAASIGTAFQNLIRTENPVQSQQHILEQLNIVTGIEVRINL
ncbi:G1/S-specific cyclin-D3-like protein [Leptotrombidium deliense]|uniref:G1/S-specific cyclin-D3-like protein n=1 Tax=Leptotrombidium deliense TaxID=299467 RepID=A0A443STW7_9ACAR|nr:G1/S-specific cyclin-D3-like protein [Leptotrombidium deliense]